MKNGEVIYDNEKFAKDLEYIAEKHYSNKFSLQGVGSSLKNKELPTLEEYIKIEGYKKINEGVYKYSNLTFKEVEVYAHYIQFIEEYI